MNLILADHLIVGLYLVLIFVLGLLFSKKDLDEENYLYAARKLSLPAFVMTLVTTWYGAILGVGEFVHGFGLVGWVINGLLWYVVYIAFAFFFARKIHDSNLQTISQQFTSRIGEKSGKIAAILTYIMTSPAAYVLSLAVFLNYVYGLEIYWAVLIGAFVSAAYIWVGGFRAVVKTDALQFLLMFGGFGALIAYSYFNYGGFEFIKAGVPATHLTFKGELSWQTIFVWGFIAFWTFVDPNFYQRCFAAKNAKTAKNGILFSLIFWIIFDLLTLATGLYARAAFPDIEPMFSYLVLADNVMPFIVKGVFLTAILAIIMSTIDSFLFASSTIIANDFLKKKYSSFSLKKLTRIGIVITLLLSLVFIYTFESIIGIIYALGTVGVSVLFLPMILALFVQKISYSDKQIARMMILTFLVSGYWLVEGWLNSSYGWPVYRFDIEPMYIGIGFSFLYFVLLWLKNKKFAAGVVRIKA